MQSLVILKLKKNEFVIARRLIEFVGLVLNSKKKSTKPPNYIFKKSAKIKILACYILKYIKKILIGQKNIWVETDLLIKNIIVF